MLFVQPFFLFVLLPAALLLFYLVARRAGATAGLAVIVVASALFYAPYGPLPATLLAASLCLNLGVGLALTGDRVGDRVARKALLVAGLVANFGALSTFKYLDQVASLIFPSAGPVLAVAIPAGISFYTFHQVVFLIDAYNRKPEVVQFLDGGPGIAGPLTAGIRYASFVAFFPQLVIGPITFLKELAPQFLSQRFGRLGRVDLQIGITLVVVGLAKKLCIADPLGEVIDPIYGNAASGVPIATRQAFLAMVGYAFQLYFDFSGYSDVALGIARLFGLRLPMNFDSPLRATGIADYYRRWHMTLTRVIVLLIFTPLSLWGTRFALDAGCRGWKLRFFTTWMPALANFQLIALWHGAKETFIAFGIAHALWYILENEVKASKRFKRYRARTSDRARLVGGIVLTTIPLMVTFALFRSDSLAAFGNLMTALVGVGPAPELDPEYGRRFWAKLLVFAAIVYLLPNIYEAMRRYRPSIRTFVNPTTTPLPFRVLWRPTLLWAVFVVVLMAAISTRLNLPTPFLYAGF